MIDEVKCRDDGSPINPVGVGRYILCFLSLGLIGLGIQYWTRHYGWRGVIISMAGAVVVAALIGWLSQPDAYCPNYATGQYEPC